MTLEEMDKQYVLQTYNRNYVNFKSGQNATLFDENGKDFIDFTSGIGVVSVGHGNGRVADAIYNQVRNITHISNIFLIEPQAKLAKKMVELSGFDMAVFFANSGAEANEGAIKIARKYGQNRFKNKRYKVLTLEYSFHGRTITTLKATGQESFHQNAFSPYPEGFAYKNQIKDIYSAIDDETVGVMIELVQGEGGVQAFDKKEIEELAAFLQKNDLLFMVDEVQTGVFRSGEFLASKFYDIEPDIITLAKGLAGGVPIGAVMTKHKDIFTYGDHGSTFGGNFLSTRAGLEVLDILEDFYKDGFLRNSIDYFDDKLKKIVENHPNLFLNKTGLGLMRGIQCKEGDIVSKTIKASFDEGLLVLKAGRNTIRFLPPLTITKDEINEGFARFEKALDKLK
ncbi:MAG: aspartate aminotransferase family protein [Campylobacteraceae bacterium]|jgi:acetylornithine aminotransferase|nr:aspartate aminotransferase family protein [Campylobacteraceae bacterium]